VRVCGIQRDRVERERKTERGKEKERERIVRERIGKH
jgi:hypothetical protein